MQILRMIVLLILFVIQAIVFRRHEPKKRNELFCPPRQPERAAPVSADIGNLRTDGR